MKSRQASAKRVYRRLRKPSHFLSMKQLRKFVLHYQRMSTFNKTTLMAGLAALLIAPFALKFTSLFNSQPLNITQLEESANYAISFDETLAANKTATASAANVIIDDNDLDSGSTLEFWVKTNFSPQDPQIISAPYSAIMQMKGDADRAVAINLFANATLRAEIYSSLADSQSVGLQTTIALPGNKWNHIALVFQPQSITSSARSNVKLFLNGTLQDSDVVSLPSNLLTAMGVVTLGNTDNPTTDLNYTSTDYDGLIEDFTLSSKARYTGNSFIPAPFGKQTVDSDTQIYWKFNQNGTDSSSNGFNAVLVNSPAFIEITDEPTHAACVEYSCVQVPGMGSDQCSAQHPCATPRPTPSPSPSPTPTTAPQNNNNTTNNQPQQPVGCQKEAPTGKPDIYQINVSNRSATLYFVPATYPYTTYVVEFGTANSWQHSASFNTGRVDGALSATVNALQPGVQYNFKVRAINDCKPGEWSNTFYARTLQSEGIKSFYKGFAGIVQQTKTTTPSTKTVSSNKTSKTPTKSAATTTAPTAPSAPQAAPTRTEAAPPTYTPPQPIPLWQRIWNFLLGK